MRLLKEIARISPLGVYADLRRRMLVRRYRAHAHEQRYDWAWRRTHYNRVALVNLLVSRTRGWNTRYLEIGCAGNDLFDAVAAAHKTGVDPVAGGTERLTSDAFFARNQNFFDVIFIDGLHHYEQVRRDALNALGCLAPGGWIAFHDMLPADWKEHHVPRLQSAWTGDCWKLAVELSAATGLDFHIVRIDHGVGLLRKKSVDWSVPDLGSSLCDAEFDTFVERVDSLPIIDFEQAVELIGAGPG